MKKKSISLLIAVAMATSTLTPATVAFADTTSKIVRSAAEVKEVTEAPASTYGVTYDTHIEKRGWDKSVKVVTGDSIAVETMGDAGISGTIGRALRVEALKIEGTNLPEGASISYDVHQQSFGWSKVAKDGEIAGVTGKAKRAEAIRVTLKGMPGYAIKYQVHVQKKGWMDAVVTENGTELSEAKIAGTTGQSLRIEALRVQIVKTDAEKDAEVKAINAVAKAEASKTQEDVDAAKEAVAAVKDATIKADLTKKVENVKVEDEDKDTDGNVVGVTPISATEAKVVFNEAVDKTEAEEASKYSVNKINPNAAKLQDDNKTVILTFSSATTLTGYNGADNVGVKNAAVVVEPITTVANEFAKTKRYVGLLSYKDEVAATVEKIESVTNGSTAAQTKVTFSEPVSSEGTVKLDGVTLSSELELSADGYTLTISKDIDASKSHSLNFYGLKDKAGNVTKQFTKDFNVTVDKTAPKIVSIEQSEDKDNTVVVTFDKDMNASTITDTNITVKDEGLANVASISVDPDSNNAKICKITMPANTFTDKTTRKLTVALTGNVKDYLGNALEATNKTVTLVKDTVAPEITGYKVVKNNDGKVARVEINCSSTVTTPNSTKISIISEDTGAAKQLSDLFGTSPNVASDVKDPKKIIITPNSNTPVTIVGKYSFTFAEGFVKDEAETANKSKAKTMTIDFGGAASSDEYVIQNEDFATDDGSNTITVDYGIGVVGGTGANSATDPANYTINGKALPKGTVISLDDATKSKATIKIPAGTIDTTDPKAVLSLSGIKTLDGRNVKDANDTIKITDNVAPTLKAAKLNDDNTITLEFSELLSTNPALGDFDVKVNGTVVPVGALGIAPGTGTDTGKYVISGLGGLINYSDPNTFFDIDNSSDYGSSDIILSTTGGDKSSNKLSSFNAITSITVETKSGTRTGADAEGNTLTEGTVVTIK